MAEIKERWYQLEALEAFKNFVVSNPYGRNPLIVMPTGTGKSVVIASMIKWVRTWPENKVLVLTHVGELVKQNARKLQDVWPQANIGYCSASLNRKDTQHGIIFGTVQTVYSLLKKDKEALGKRCLVIIDECHLLSEKSSSQYRTVLRTLKEQCPELRVCGLSATPYRERGKLLTEQKDPIFTDVAYDLTKKFTQLIDEGYLAPLVALPTPVSVNLEGVHIKGGEFKDDELQKAVGNEVLLNQACDIMVKEGAARKAWLVFVSGIKNAENVTLKLQKRGVTALTVNSSRTKEENDKAIAGFRSGEVKCLVSANQLTTGFDVPQVDLIGMLRPTMSVSLHVQSLGRGTRPAPNKTDCLVLDFARNIERLGAINDPLLSNTEKRESKGPNDEPAKPRFKRCDNCGKDIPINARICPVCGYQPPQDLDLRDLSNIEIIAYSTHRPHRKGAIIASVRTMLPTVHRSQKGAECIRVGLDCVQGPKNFKAWLYMCFDAGNMTLAKREAGNLWRKLGGNSPAPFSTLDAARRLGELRAPKEIELFRANAKRKYDELLQTFY